MIPNLPLVVCGPIVRRSTLEKVSVWLATSRMLDRPKLQIYTGKGPLPLHARHEYYSVQLGRFLHVWLLVAQPAKPLDEGQIYTYDITHKHAEFIFSVQDRRQFSLSGFRRPSFVIGSPRKGTIRALYGSCRKLHGIGPDMMIAAETVLQRTAHVGADAKPNRRRPEVLLLGGDQIYADDVHKSFHRLSVRLKIALFGGRDPPVAGLDPHSTTLGGDRSGYLKGFFTSTHMEHHLLTLGEYACAYLLAWNGELWPKFIDKSVVKPSDKPLLRAARGAASARRALANTVTYMIFDDHEITDDWFLNDDWQITASRHDGGREVMTNGLLAYWAFQGWGNNPDSFDDGFLNLMGSYAVDRSHLERTYAALVGHAWSYVAPTDPPILFMDTRTKRTGSPAHDDVYGGTAGVLLDMQQGTLGSIAKRNERAPRLLNRREQRHLNEILQDRPVSGGPLIVVSATPVFGKEALERIQNWVGKVDPTILDLESWASNPRNFLDFAGLFEGRRPRPLIILSGDVHYGFETVGRMSSPRRGGVSIPFLQLNSSAIKNRLTPEEQSVLAQIARRPRTKQLASRERVFWNLSTDAEADGAIHVSNSLSSSDSEPDLAVSLLPVDKHPEHPYTQFETNLGDLAVDQGMVAHRLLHGDPKQSAQEFLSFTLSSWPVR